MEGGFLSQVYHITKQNKEHWGSYINGTQIVFSCKKYDHNYVFHSLVFHIVFV